MGIVKVCREAVKEEDRRFAFTAFLLGAGGDKTFGDYLRNIGMSEEPEMPELTAKECIAIANRIKRKR